MRRLSSILAAVCLLMAAPAAQLPRTATIDAFATDGDGRPIAGLTAADFRVVTASGEAIPVTAARAVSIPPATRGKATAVETLPLEASNEHGRDARLFVVIVESFLFQPAIKSAREFFDELLAGLADEDQVALFVAGFPERSLPPTGDVTVLARAFDAIPQARPGFDRDGMTLFIRDNLPKIYGSLMATHWAARSVVVLGTGLVGPEAFRDYKSWNAWAQRANAPMHGIDPFGSMAMGDAEFVAGDHALLRQASTETGGLLVVNHASLKGAAAKVIAAASQFYELEIDVPVGIKTDQSFYTSVKTHPTSKTKARLRVRIAEPNGLDAHATNELRNALSAPLPLDEIPFSLALESTTGATAATVKFEAAGGPGADARVITLPAGPLTIAFAAVTDRGKLQMLGTREVSVADAKIEGCCMTVRQDIVIPKNAIEVRASVYQQPTGKVGAVFLTIEKR